METKSNFNILVDTSIPLEGGEELIAKLEKVAPVFVTDIVLQELDGKKGAEGSVGYNAREFFRKLGRDNGVEMFVLPPNNVKLEKTDTLRKMTLGVTPIYVIVRKPYKSRDINDSKIIEIAKDYNMKLVTLDMAQRVRAMSEGVDVAVLDAIITPNVYKNTEKVQAMSEIEKLRNKTEKENKDKMDFPWGATIGFMVVGALLSLGSDNFLGTFGLVSIVILFFAFISSVAKPVEGKKLDNKDEKDEHSSEFLSEDDWSKDPMYSSLHGNIYHQ